MVKFYPPKAGDPCYDATAVRDAFPPDANAHVEQFARGELLERPGEPVSALRVLISGRAKIYMIHGDGRQSILQFLEPGDYVGELSLLGVEAEPKYVEALSPCMTLTLPFAENGAKLLADAAFLRKLCVFLAKKLLARSERLTQNLNYPLRNRLASLILTAAHDGAYTLRHAEAAEYLGVSYRHLLYSLARFREEGLVEKRGREYFVKDPVALRRLAGDIRA